MRRPCAQINVLERVDGRSVVSDSIWRQTLRMGVDRLASAPSAGHAQMGAIEARDLTRTRSNAAATASRDISGRLGHGPRDDRAPLEG